MKARAFGFQTVAGRPLGQRRTPPWTLSVRRHGRSRGAAARRTSAATKRGGWRRPCRWHRACRRSRPRSRPRWTRGRVIRTCRPPSVTIPSSLPWRSALRAGSWRPVAREGLDLVLRHRLDDLQPRTHDERQQALFALACELTPGDTHGIGEHERRLLRSSARVLPRPLRRRATSGPSAPGPDLVVLPVDGPLPDRTPDTYQVARIRQGTVTSTSTLGGPRRSAAGRRTPRPRLLPTGPGRGLRSRSPRARDGCPTPDLS